MANGTSFPFAPYHKIYSFFFFFLSERERVREKEQGRRAEGEKEAGSPLSREPNSGLDHRTLRS